MSFPIRKVIGLSLGAAAAAMGGLIAVPTLHDRLWIGHAMFSEFPWVTSFIGGAGMITSLARSPRSPGGALLAAAGIGLSMLPMIQARAAMEDMNRSMLNGLGKHYEKQIPSVMLERVSPKRWTVPNTLKWQYVFPGVKVTHDVLYSQPGLRPLKFDVYEPTSPPPIGTHYPAIVSVHGGAWRSYDKGGVFVPHHSHLAAQGYVVFDIQYRFSGEAVWPAQLQDVQCAVRWVRAHARDYNIDPKRIALLGRSSGGHMALMAAYRANDPHIGRTCLENEDSSVSAVVALYPPSANGSAVVTQGRTRAPAVDLVNSPAGAPSEPPKAWVVQKAKDAIGQEIWDATPEIKAWVIRDYLNALALSGIVWSAAFALFVLPYGPILLRPGQARILAR